MATYTYHAGHNTSESMFATGHVGAASRVLSVGPAITSTGDFWSTETIVVAAETVSAALPDALAGGEANTYVYYGVRDGKNVYVGITNNIARRGAEHGERFALDPITAQPVTRGEARAIEQAVIARNPGFENKINSISPNQPYYQQAVDWGKSWLNANGIP